MSPENSLGRSAARGGAVTMLGQLFRIIIQFAGLIILARILSPHDYGLMAVMMVIVGLAEVVRDFGLTQASVQTEHLSISQRDNLFWLNTAIGAALTITVFLAAPTISWIFSAPELTGIARWTSLIFLVNGMSTQYRASLNRSMRFGSLAVVDISASAIGLISAFIAAISGLGYWALVIQQLAFAPVALLIAALSARWVPRWINRDGNIRGLATYGVNLLGTQLINNFYRNIDTLIIGTRFGTAATGYYDRAFQVLMLPLNQLNAPATKVALPTLSRLNSSPTDFNRFLLTGQAAMVHVLFGIFAFIAAATDPLVKLALGDQWDPSVVILKILCLAGCAQAASYASYWVFLARGLTAQNLRYALATRPAMMALIAVGSFWGVNGVAAGYAAGLLFSWPVAVWWLKRHTPLPAKEMILNGLYGFVSWGFVWLITSIADHLSASLTLFPRIAIDLLAYVLSIGIVWLALPQFRKDIKQLATVLGLLRR